MDVLITTSTFGKYDRRPLELLEKKGLSYSLNPYGRKLTKEELFHLAGDYIGIISGTESFDSEILKRFRKVKAISRCGSGLDNIDLKTAKGLSIIVTNTPDCVTMAVAELTVGFMLSLLRKTFTMDRDMKAGKWNKVMGYLLSGKNIGIIGFGKIGQKVAELLMSFETHIGYYDIVKSSCSFGKYMDLRELLMWSDIVTIHVSRSEKSSYLLASRELSYLKKGAWFINCARGEVVDEKALYEALKSKRLSGAAIDVFEQEPYCGPLIQLENVILTPHIGSYAQEARIRMEMEAVLNLLESLRGQT